MVYSLITLLIFVLLGSPPKTIEACFDMLRENRLNGLLRLDILTVAVLPFYYVLFYSLYRALRKTNKGLTPLATILTFMGLTLVLAMPSVFSYLHLSDQYSLAATETQRNQLLAAGEAIRASDTWHGTGAVIGAVLLQGGALIISFVMLQGNTFSKLTAYSGIVTHGLDLLHIIIGIFLPSVGVVLMAVAGPLYLLWFPLVGIRLIKLSRMNQ